MITRTVIKLINMQMPARRHFQKGALSAQKSTEHGFTLAELIVTVLVAGIAIISIVNLFAAISISQRNVWYEDVATRTARSEIENARAKGIGSLATGNTDIKNRLPSTLPSDATGVMNVGSVYAGQARLVTVTITWQGGVKKVVLTGTIGQQGLLP